MLLIKPNLDCNIHCQYCYENSWRNREKRYIPEYNLEKVIEAIDRECDQGNITLHGGEPLMLPRKDVEKILKKSYELTGHSGIQTNGLAIDEEYMDMFEKYKTVVGVSLDGLGKLNRARTNERVTGKIFSKMIEMHRRKINLSLISVVSKANAETDELLEEFKHFIETISELKITGRINPCIDYGEWELDPSRMIEVYKDLTWFVIENDYRWSPFTDVKNSLTGKGSVVCTFLDCDIFSTHSATVILGDGSVTSCMRVSSKGLYERHPAEYKTRSEILAQVEQLYGGCKDCRWWENCKGGCPSQAIDEDWRNRTVLCPLYKSMFQLVSNMVHYGDQPVPPGKCSPEKSKPVEHIDGGMRHLDSPHGDSLGGRSGHSDGIEHIDGSTRHLDG